MKKIKKMAQPILLSSPDAGSNEFYQQQKLLTRPEVFRMSKLDQTISETLARSDISGEEKYELYNAALADFRKVRGDVLKRGTMLEPTTDILIQNQIPTGTSSQSTEEMLKSIAQLLQDISSSEAEAESPRHLLPPAEESSSKPEVPVKKEAPSRKGKKAAVVSSKKKKKKTIAPKKRPTAADSAKLSAELMRASNFKEDLMDKFFTTEDGSVDVDGFKRIVGVMTNKKKNAASSVPQEDVRRAQDVYNFMMEKNVDVSPWMKDYPMFSQLSANVSLPARKRGRRKTTGSGVVGRGGRRGRFFVNWKSWDSRSRINN